MEAIAAFLFVDFLGKPVWIWFAFLAIVVTLLALDLVTLQVGAGSTARRSRYSRRAAKGVSYGQKI